MHAKVACVVRCPPSPHPPAPATRPGELPGRDKKMPGPGGCISAARRPSHSSVLVLVHVPPAQVGTPCSRGPVTRGRLTTSHTERGRLCTFTSTEPQNRQHTTNKPPPRSTNPEGGASSPRCANGCLGTPRTAATSLDNDLNDRARKAPEHLQHKRVRVQPRCQINDPNDRMTRYKFTCAFADKSPCERGMPPEHLAGARISTTLIPLWMPV